jgi:SSS family solute:Na+ symporter
MEIIGITDIIVFIAFVASVIAIGLWKSKGEELRSEHGAQDYFLAGRGLTWWLVGFSLIAANISTEQFVGMSGKAADWLGMAIASYEWMAAITLVVVAFVFLPTFLKSGIYTIPEFLEYRYNTFARTVMAIVTMIILVGVPTASVIYSGAKVIGVFFHGKSMLGLDLGNITVGCWIIGILAAIYVFAGGLKACAWADLIQGAALILGGVIIAYFAMRALGMADVEKLAATATSAVDPDQLKDMGALARLKALNAGDWAVGKMHMVKPASDPEIPWTALVVGLWIPNFFYWGLNQYITQRTLGSKSLDQGQKGVVFAAFLKLIIPFIVVIPGILAFNLFSDDLHTHANVKNQHILEQFKQGESQIYIFTDTYAKLNTDQARDLYLANAAMMKQPVDSVLLGNANMLFEANSALVHKATKINQSSDSAESITISEKLVGYDYDAAFPTLLKGLIPVGFGILGFVLAAIFGAVVSSLASMLNSASTIATMDIYNKLRKSASQFELVSAGRIFTILFVLIAMLIAPMLDSPKFGGIFTFIQEFQGFISPGVLAIFLFGLLVQRTPRFAGTVGLILNPILYGILKWGGGTGIGFLVTLSSLSFLDRMAVCFFIVILTMTVITLIKPLPKPVELPVNEKMDVTVSKSAKRYGFGVVALTLLLYIIFW